MKKLATFLFLSLLLVPLNSHAESHTVWPLSGKGKSSPDTITSDYGPRKLSGSFPFHYGLDLRARTPQPVKSTQDDTIANIFLLPNDTTGNYVEMASGFRYLHLSTKTSDYEIRNGFDKEGDPATYIVFKDSKGKTVKVFSNKADVTYKYDHDNNTSTDLITEPVSRLRNKTQQLQLGLQRGVGKRLVGNAHPTAFMEDLKRGWM